MLVSHFIPWLSTITDNWHVGETVSREICFSRKSYFALMPHRKVDFTHSQAAFDLLCPFVSLLLLPGELRWAKLVMMPQQASVFHQTVLEKTAQRWKPSGQEWGHSLQQQFRPKTVYLGHMAEGIRCQEPVQSKTETGFLLSPFHQMSSTGVLWGYVATTVWLSYVGCGGRRLL